MASLQEHGMDPDDEGGTSDLSTSAGDPEDNRNSSSISSNGCLKISTIDETEAFQVMPLKEEPFDSDPSSDPDQRTNPKRKRPSNSEFCDISEAAPVSTSQTSGLAPVKPSAPLAAAATPQGMVPVFAVGNTGMMVPANAFWMIPQAAATAAPANQQIWALSPSLTPVFNVAAARPISSFVTSTNSGNETGVNTAAAGSVVNIPSEVEFRSPSPVVASTSVGAKVAKKSIMAPSVSSNSGSGKGGKAQMLRDFSLEIYDKQELQLMGRPGNNQPRRSKS
ncbi:hypothetical protein POTOM_000909 [Populus tomentosa]|uniref:Uncharacterized protein n=1 Tax=Populus tomentosa TaxID=118781 RepID=A0A8X8IUL2_POPTO|nr:hypothetical protein POTOM_000909 [Populus tomentosa]